MREGGIRDGNIGKGRGEGERRGEVGEKEGGEWREGKGGM